MRISLLTTGRHDLAYLTPIKDIVPGCEWLKVLAPVAATPLCVIEQAALSIEDVSTYFMRRKPDILIVVGDRSETLAVCLAATILKIPIAHLHGGEITLGAIDNKIRNSISHLASIHFTATESAAERLEKMQVPGKVFVTGSPALDLMFRKKRIRTCGRDVLVAHHPTTLGDQSPLDEIKSVVEKITPMIPHGGKAIYTGANPDAGGQIMNEHIQSLGDPWIFRPHMSAEEYYDLLAGCAFLAGNSSSGVIEAPALGVPWMEIGTRQAGRSRESYGDGHACERIAKALAEWQDALLSPVL